MNDLRDAFDFSGKVIVVAGGNGLIGSAITKSLSKLHAISIVLDQGKNNIENVKNVHFIEITQNYSQDSIKETIDSIELNFGPIFGLINCMTTKANDENLYFSAISDYTLSTWKEIVEGNLHNTFLLCKEIGLRMVSRSKGSIVNFCSIYGAEMGPDLRIYDKISTENKLMTTPVSYTVSKGGIQALSKHLATSWAQNGVRVNAISPGGVFNNQSKEFVGAYSNRVPFGRMAHVEEIIGLPIFLLSDLSSYITGQNLFIDGGLSAW
jgi:NAD(P)-dependent dehydrogenase (short-subunit alcohol dehydrogenase family)